MLMAQPLLSALKTLSPTTHISVLAPLWVAPVLAYMAEVDVVIPTQFSHGTLQGWQRLKLARILRGQFDECYVLPNSWKSAVLPWLAKIPRRFGYLGERRYGLLNRYLANPEKKHRPPMVAHYAALAQLSGIYENTQKISLTDPKLIISQQEVAQVIQHFHIDMQKPLLVFCPGAEFGPAKRWPAQHFSQLAQLLVTEFPHLQIVALGSKKDKIIAENIALPVRNLCGETSLEQAIALIAHANAVVCNDSGLMHIAAALGKPQVSLFGSSDPRHTPPRSSKAVPIWLQLACSPCYARNCPLGHLRCLQDITPNQVLPIVRTMLPSQASSILATGNL